MREDHRTPRVAGGVDDAVDHEGRSLQLEFGEGSEVIGLKAPGDFELVEVARVDLVERAVASALHVGAVPGPLGIFLMPGRCGGLAPGEKGGRKENNGDLHGAPRGWNCSTSGGSGQGL